MMFSPDEYYEYFLSSNAYLYNFQELLELLSITKEEYKAEHSADAQV